MSWPGYPLVGLNSRCFLLFTSTVLPRQGSAAAPPATYILAISLETILSPPSRHSGTLTTWGNPRDSFSFATVNNRKHITTRRSAKSITTEQKMDSVKKSPQITSLGHTNFLDDGSTHHSQRARRQFALSKPISSRSAIPVSWVQNRLKIIIAS